MAGEFRDYKREVARRVFAQEFRESDLFFKESEEEFAPNYLITPTGAKCNRVFIVGVLTEKDKIGEEVDYWRGRVADPTGAFYVYAGQYQEEAARALADIEPPEFISVVGKVSVYEPEGGDGTKLNSIRAESINVVDANTRDRWVMDTARHTIKRLNALNLDSKDEVIKKAIDHYSPIKSHYKIMVLEALESLKESEIDQPDEEVVWDDIYKEEEIDLSNQ
ncbi:MAG: RPA family protein [Methanosarcinales archaeon]